ncbi:hypothetical protein [Aureispira anguillae]|uniref:Uncharacterized protein n=1 Tax=Aureispira anguillae TaxID=2864201 RepID=A0A915YAS9_9BACT|nr:hypothetical protein [Aureispira anguillae]BDS09571.1 hypothetical protein AsAng_0002750 [Aureispira anguillae]
MIPKIIINDFYFHSYDHLRYESGICTTSLHANGARRAIKIESASSNRYSVTIFNLDGPHPIWRNNVQMAPKLMKVIKAELYSTELRGCGPDIFGNNFEDFGITIKHSSAGIDEITLHLLDRDSDIKYLKSNEKNPLIPTYIRTENEYHTLDDLTEGFRKDVIAYLQSLERKKRPNIVYVGEIIDVCSFYAIRLMDVYRENALGILPVNIVTEVKDQVYQVVADLIPEMEKKEAKNTFWDTVNYKMTLSNIVAIAREDLDNLEYY